MSSKTEILALGCGGCGNNQLDTLLKSDKMYTGIFFNTNLREMEDLETFDRDRRCFYIPNADGTGKNRNLTESYLKTEAPKFAEMISKFVIQKRVTMFSSANGGSGSKAVTMLPKLVKKISPDKTITLIGTFPSLSETDIDFENTIDFWNELIDAKDRGFIDNFMFIDNNWKGTESDINRLAIESYNDMFEVIGGKVDSSDLARVFDESGYIVVLKLDDRIRDTAEAIDKAIDDSVFFIPENLECEVLVATVNTRYFNVDRIREKIPAYSFNKINETTEGDTIIVIGGCHLPKEPVELVQEALNELENKARGKRSKNNDLKVDVNRVRDNKNKNSSGKKTFTKEDLKNLFEDDSFWD